MHSKGNDEACARAAEINANLTVKANKSGPVWYGVWRDSNRRSQMKIVGKAWLERRTLPPTPNPFLDGATIPEPTPTRQLKWPDKWDRKRGQKRAGYLDEKGAAVELLRIVTEHEQSLIDAETQRVNAANIAARQTLADAAEGWFAEAQYERDLRHSTIKDYRYVLNGSILNAPQFRDAPPGFDRTVLDATEDEQPDITDYRKRLQLLVDRAQAENWPLKELSAITTRDVKAWRDSLVQMGGISRRTANKNLQLVRNVLGFAVESEDFALTENVAAKVKKLTERAPGFVDYFEPGDIDDIALVLERGQHRNVAAPAGGVHVRDDAKERRAYDDQQDATLVRILYFAGLRLGEALGLRWSDVDFAGGVIRVQRSYVLGQEDVPKSGKPRIVPLADDLVPVLDQLSKRGFSTGHGDLVVVGANRKSHMDGSAFRRRWKKALRVANKREMRLHGLRHAFASIVQGSAADHEVRAWVGHQDPRTLARYSHAKGSDEDRHTVTDAFKKRRTMESKRPQSTQR